MNKYHRLSLEESGTESRSAEATPGGGVSALERRTFLKMAGFTLGAALSWGCSRGNDRKLVLQPDTCGVDPTGCRRLVVLSNDASDIEEEVLDPDHHQLPWPYGFEREGHDDYGQSVYWRHLDPVGLDLPCLLFEGSQMDYRASFDGGALAATSGLYCY